MFKLVYCKCRCCPQMAFVKQQHVLPYSFCKTPCTPRQKIQSLDRQRLVGNQELLLRICQQINSGAKQIGQVKEQDAQTCLLFLQAFLQIECYFQSNRIFIVHGKAKPSVDFQKCLSIAPQKPNAKAHLAFRIPLAPAHSLQESRHPILPFVRNRTSQPLDIRVIKWSLIEVVCNYLSPQSVQYCKDRVRSLQTELFRTNCKEVSLDKAFVIVNLFLGNSLGELPSRIIQSAFQQRAWDIELLAIIIMTTLDQRLLSYVPQKQLQNPAIVLALELLADLANNQVHLYQRLLKKTHDFVFRAALKLHRERVNRNTLRSIIQSRWCLPAKQLSEVLSMQEKQAQSWLKVSGFYIEKDRYCYDQEKDEQAFQRLWEPQELQKLKMYFLQLLV